MPGSLVTLEVDGSPMRTYAAVPDGDGPFPVVMVAQHRLGLDGFMRGVCDRLADAGYAAVAPDLKHRDWTVELFDEVTSLPRGSARAEEVLTSLPPASNDEFAVSDMNAASAHLRELPSVGSAPIGVVGFCGGGRVASLRHPELGPNGPGAAPGCP